MTTVPTSTPSEVVPTQTRAQRRHFPFHPIGVDGRTACSPEEKLERVVVGNGYPAISQWLREQGFATDTEDDSWLVCDHVRVPLLDWLDALDELRERQLDYARHHTARNTKSGICHYCGGVVGIREGINGYVVSQGGKRETFHLQWDGECVELPVDAV